MTQLPLCFDAPQTPGVQEVLSWLRAHVASDARLRADSREICPGDVFLAYAVDGADSRAHAEAARQRGAAAVLWHPEGARDAAAMPAPAGDASCAVLAVSHLDVLVGPIASGWYGEPSATMTVLGVTGTNGKTSCSHWLSSALDASGTRCAIVGTLGTGLPGQVVATGFTTPDAARLQHSLRELATAGARAVAMEVSSHALHQGRVNGVEFDVALFTNLTQDHLDYHGDLAHYEAAKGRLFDWPGLRAAVVNRDDAAGRRLLARLRGKVPTIAYGLEVSREALGDRELFATDIRASAQGTAFVIDGSWGRRMVETHTIGRFNVANLLAVAGGLLALDMDWESVLTRLSELEPVRGRMECLGGRPGSDEPLVVIDYAHTPDGLEQTLLALRAVADARAGRLLVAFGCGGDRDTGKRPLMGEIAARLADCVVLTSDNPRSEPPAQILAQIAAGIPAEAQARVRSIEDRASAILQSVRAAAPADVVLLAGKGHESTQEIAGRKRPFSDHDSARLALAARATQAGAPSWGGMQ